ncbi:MAG TPA: M66 family metalloprotease [Polyangiales bacterium]|nr:M66 family metalloprotease [Polyangiales bacterium]
MKTRSISAAAKLSVLGLLAYTALLGACSGLIEPLETGARSTRTGDAGEGEAANTRDARVVEDEPRGEEEVEDGGEPADGGPAPSERDATVAARDAGRDAAGPVDAGSAAPDAGTPASTGCGANGPFAKGLKVRELALYQTVKVSLYKSGAWATTTPVPVVAGKKALVRVFVDTQAGYAAHAVRAVLTLKSAQGETKLENERTIAASSTDADEATTFGFTVEPSKLTPDTQLSVSLEEIDCGAQGGQASDARLPATGTQAVGVEAIGKLKVVVLPIDIGGRLPKTDDAELAKIRAVLLAFYPVPDVEVTVRATPFTGPSAVTGADSATWSNVLNSVMRERANDRVASNVYYFGLMQPAATFATFCQRGCILGIAPQSARVSASAQAGLAAYFSDNQSMETIVHELGHAHGRGHAPCVKAGSIEGVDGNFPDMAGGILDWGWDSRTSKLISPASYKDIMGYCSPNWISGYTYGGLATRSKAVNTLALVHGGESATTWQNVLLYADGSARWGGAFETRMPGGDVETATVLDASGQSIETIQVTRLVLSHTDDVIVYLPSPGARWASVVLRDRTLSLSTILPAL